MVSTRGHLLTSIRLMVSQTAEYALLAVITLADHYPNSQSVKKIAITTSVPPGYLSKVLQRLARNNIVHANLSTRVGFVLAKPPAEITALEVVNAVASTRPRIEGRLSTDARGPEFDSLNTLFKTAHEFTERVLRESSIASMVPVK